MMTQRPRLRSMIGAGALAVLATGAYAQAQVQQKAKSSSVSRPVTELAYGKTGLSDRVHGELYAAPAYGEQHRAGPVAAPCGLDNEPRCHPIDRLDAFAITDPEPGLVGRFPPEGQQLFLAPQHGLDRI